MNLTSCIYLFNINNCAYNHVHVQRKKLYCYSVKDLNIQIFLDFHHKNSDNFQHFVKHTDSTLYLKKKKKICNV